MSFNFNKELSLKQAENFLKQNQISAAINEYKKIVDVTQDLNIMNLLGDLYIRVGDDRKAIECFSPVAANYASNGFTVKAIAMYKKICKLDANNMDMILKLAELYVNQKYLVEARQLYNQVLESYKKTKSNQDIIKILKLINEADPENISKKIELASFYEKENLSLESQESYFDACRELLKHGREEEGLKILEELFSKHPNSKMTLVNFVDALVITKNGEKAIEILRKTIRKTPNDLDLLIVLGKTYLRLNKLDEAEKTFVDLLIRDSNRYEYLIELAKIFLANKEFDRVVDLLDLFTDTILEKKQKRKLTTILKEILKENPNHLKTVKSLAYIYKKIDETSNLIATLKLLVKVARNNGKETEAINALRTLMELEPENVSYKETLQNINTGNLNSNAAKDLQKGNASLQNNLSQSKQNKDSMQSNHTKELIETMITENGSYLDAQMQLLEDMVAANADFLEARIKLKNVYAQKELKEKASKECIEIAKLYISNKQLEKAKKVLEDACQYYPLIAEVEEFKSVLGEIKTDKEIVATRSVAGESGLLVQGKKDTKSRKKLPENSFSIPSTIVKTTPIMSGSSQLPMDIFSKQQIKENIELNFSAPLEIDLSSMFSKDLETQTKPISVNEVPSYDVETKYLLAKDISWLADANQPLDREWRRGIRSNQEISLVLIKVDNFKEYLDSFGQALVDSNIKSLLKVIENTVHRGGDQLITCGRKDILFLILPETASDGALTVAQRIKIAVSGASNVSSPNLFTVSQLIATGRPKRSNKPTILVKKILSGFSKLSSVGQILLAEE